MAVRNGSGRRRVRRFLSTVLAVLLPVGGHAAPSGAEPDRLLAFLAERGCAIGAPTIAEATAAGFDTGAIDRLKTEAKPDPDTVETGGWTILPPRLCTITPPRIDNALKLTDPEVRQAISSPDAEAKGEGASCVISVETLFETVGEAKGWDVNKLNAEYLRLLAASVLNGEMSFYSNDPLSTPPGFQITTGTCAGLPAVDKMKRENALLIRFFDPLLRANARTTECEEGVISFFDTSKAARDMSKGEITNEWLGMELMIIAMGAGWYDGTTYTNKGKPRPPFCHYR